MAFEDCFFFCLMFLYFGIPETIGSRSQPCYFLFYTGFKDNMTTQENDVINFTFRVNDTSCWTGKNIRIEVHKNGLLACLLSQSGNVCKRSSRTTACSCVQDGLYLFHKEITRDDEGNWTWYAKEGYIIVARETILFNIHYQANILRLKVDGQDRHSYTLVRHQTASIVCIWENGNPSVTARLLDNNGNILRNETHQNLTYTYMASNCQSETKITCEAGGSRKNISIILLTICSPVFIHSAYKPVVSTKHSFPVRTYTTNISECSIYKPQQSGPSDTENKYHPENRASYENVKCPRYSTYVKFSCESSLDNDHHEQYCFCSLKGTVPDLNLTLQLHNFKEQDDGEWWLALSNLAGCNTIGFTLRLSVEK